MDKVPNEIIINIFSYLYLKNKGQGIEYRVISKKINELIKKFNCKICTKGIYSKVRKNTCCNNCGHVLINQIDLQKNIKMMNNMKSFLSFSKKKY